MRTFSAAVRLCVVVVGLGFCSGCLTMQVPERFLVVERGPGVLRALTPEESKIWVRDFDDDTRGSLSFWKDALKADLINNRGYTLMEEGSLQDGGGREGALLLMEATLGGRAVRELMAVFVVPGLCTNTIRVAEFVADKEAFGAEVEGVKQALTTLQ